MTAIALYGLHDEPYVDSVRRSLSELAPILGNEQYSRYLVLGGDFNILAGKAPSKRPHPGHELLEEKIKAYGFIDCLASALPPDRYHDLIRRTDMDNCRCGLREACTHTRTYHRADAAGAGAVNTCRATSHAWDRAPEAYIIHGGETI